MANRIAGKVKYFDYDHGQGFITPNDHSGDLKVFYVDLDTEFGNYQTLGVDTEVEFYAVFVAGQKVAKNVTGKNGEPIPLKRRLHNGDPAVYANRGSKTCENCIWVNGICSTCGFEEKYGGGSRVGESSSGDAVGKDSRK